jgi:hypothetical protein
MTRLITVVEQKIFIRVIKSRRMRWAGLVARMGHRGVTCRVSVGRREGKRLLGRPWIRREDNIENDLQEVGRTGIEWIHMALERGRWRAPVNVVMNLRVP